jgi:predicted ArsR family transcriptional regulator
MARFRTPQEARRSEILKICSARFCSLGEICEILEANKNTIRSRYLYPMTKEGLLDREYQKGTKNGQRYKAAK